MGVDPDAGSATRAQRRHSRRGARPVPYLVMAETNIKIEHWILQHPRGGGIDPSRWPSFFRFRGDYRLVSLTYHCASLPQAIDLTGNPR